MNAEDYRRLTYDLTLAVARQLLPGNPRMQSAAWGAEAAGAARRRYLCHNDEFVTEFIFSILSVIGVFFRSRCDTAPEVLALRQQLAVLQRIRPLTSSSSWSSMASCLAPRRVSSLLALAIRPRGGRPKISDEIRNLIRRLVDENLDWRAPKIHGELLKLGFPVSERSVALYLGRLRSRGHPAKGWRAFLQNHREVFVAFDFFTVPTLTFQRLYCFFAIEHQRHKILHFKVSQHPTGEWVIQQLRESFPEAAPHRYVIFDRDSIFDANVITFLKATVGNRNERSSAHPGRMEPRNAGLAVAAVRSWTT